MYVCMYIYIYIYVYIHVLYIYIHIYTHIQRSLKLACLRGEVVAARSEYTRSPLEDSRLFGPSPWNILATTYEKNDF